MNQLFGSKSRLLPLLAVLTGLYGLLAFCGGLNLLKNPPTYTPQQLAITPDLVGKQIVLKQYVPYSQWTFKDDANSKLFWYPIGRSEDADPIISLTNELARDPVMVCAYHDKLNPRAAGFLRPATASELSMIGTHYQGQGAVPSRLWVADFTGMGNVINPGMWRIVLGIQLMSVGFGLAISRVLWRLSLGR